MKTQLIIICSLITMNALFAQEDTFEDSIYVESIDAAYAKSIDFLVSQSAIDGTSLNAMFQFSCKNSFAGWAITDDLSLLILRRLDLLDANGNVPIRAHKIWNMKKARLRMNY